MKYSTKSSAEGQHIFDGDRGILPLEARETLSKLVLDSHIVDRYSPAEWTCLVKHEKEISIPLSELCLKLELDREHGIAIIRKPNDSDFDLPSILPCKKLNFIDSILMIELRKKLVEAEIKGEIAAIDINEIRFLLRIYRRSSDNDSANFEKRISAAIKRAQERNIIHSIRGSDGRFEISPILRIVFGADEIAALSKKFERMEEKHDNAEP